MQVNKLRLLGARRFWEGQALALGAVLAATMLRHLMSPLVRDEMPHIPFLAAVLAVGLRGGMAAGITATLLGAIAANWVFVGSFGRFAFEADDLWASAFFVLFGLAVTWLAVNLTSALRREAALSARMGLVNGELQHRMKNLVAVVQSIIAQSARSSTSAADLRVKVNDRLHAMSHALRLLSLTSEQVSLIQLVHGVLEPFEAEEQIQLDGPEVSVGSETAIQLALLLHELATNAAKYGALSAAGQVALTWKESDELLALVWIESGGPEVREPTRTGFGSRLVRAALPDGVVRLDYRPEGVVCSVEIRR